MASGTGRWIEDPVVVRAAEELPHEVVPAVDAATLASASEIGNGAMTRTLTTTETARSRRRTVASGGEGQKRIDRQEDDPRLLGQECQPERPTPAA